MPGGCPCVRPGGDPGFPTGFQVKRVIRTEDADKLPGVAKSPGGGTPGVFDVFG